MPKDFFQDMVRVKRENAALGKKELSTPVEKSIPNPNPPSPKISFQEPMRAEPARTERRSRREEETEFASVYDVAGKNPDGGSSRRIWVLTGISVLIFIFALSLLFSEAKITLDPRSQDVALNKNFFAAKGNLTNDLSFDLVVVSGEEKRTVEGTEEKEVSEPAEGVAVLYNNFSTASQRLDINTRLEGSNGKIYKTKTAVTVPGRKADGTPGSVEVGIYAAESGTAYNSAPLDFTIFGFRGTPKYSKFYGRSKGELSGGFSGTFKNLSESEQARVLTDMKEALEKLLLGKVEGSIPAGFILFPDATSLVVEGETVEPLSPEEGTVSLSVRGTLYGFLLEESRLTAKIADTTLDDYDGSEVYIAGLRDLDFTIYNQDALTFKDTRNITFSLSGDVKIVWRLPAEQIVKDMLGRRKKDFPQVLSRYPNVITGNVTLSPFWRRAFPEKADDIKIVINYPE